MKKNHRMWMILVAVFLLLTGCAASPAENTTPPETAAPTEATAIPTAEPTEPEPTLPPVELPQTDAATGTLCFYFGDKVIYAGGPVADLLELEVQTYADLEEIVQPGYMSDVVRLQMTAEEEKPYVFFVAMNVTDEPQKISDCILYSLTINTSQGVAFGSGQEQEHFYTGKTTLDEMVAAYGEPDYQQSRQRYYREIAYYEPFNCAYFSFKNGVVRQIFTYYSANVFTQQAQAFNHELTGYFGNDCYILMNQYLDVTPYLPDAEPVAESVGMLTSFVDHIEMDGETVTLGTTVAEMPELFKNELTGLKVPLGKNCYITMGRNNPEEFWLINQKGNSNGLADNLTVKGVITKNFRYCNWGADQGLYHDFAYDGLTQDATIEDILEKYGAPKKLDCTSNARKCFAWMEYEDENGNYVHFCVDPILNQIIEININQYYPNQKHA